jgi:hypothetical protein
MRILVISILLLTLTACVGIPDSDGFFGIPGL